MEMAKSAVPLSTGSYVCGHSLLQLIEVTDFYNNYYF